MSRTTTKYDGEASISPIGYPVAKKYRVWMQGANVTAEVYITPKQARAIYDNLAVHFERKKVSGD